MELMETTTNAGNSYGIRPFVFFLFPINAIFILLIHFEPCHKTIMISLPKLIKKIKNCKINLQIKYNDKQFTQKTQW
jgi:hypothetical protein